MSDYRQLHYYPQHPSPQQPTTGPSAQNNPNSGPTSQPDDLKYIAKYKDLKRKVQETELDNDRLLLKVLKTKRNIQRLRLERAILYERLMAMSAPNNMPFPTDPGASSLGQPQQPHNSLHNSAQYGNHITPDTDAGFIPQAPGAPHAYAHHPQGLGRPFVSNPPSQHHPQHHAEGSPRAGSSRSHKPAPELAPPVAPPAPAPGITPGPDGARNFPFVLEYAPGPITAAPETVYPTEVRFYPYESSTHPAPRNRRDPEQPVNSTRATERDRELKFRHHRIETQAQSQTHSPRTAHGNYAYPLQHPFLSSEEARRGLDSDHASRGSHGSSQSSEETRRREPTNGSRKSFDAGPGTLHQRPREDHDEYGQQQDVVRKLPSLRMECFEQSEQDQANYEWETQHERQNMGTHGGEGAEHSTTPGRQGGTMD